MKPVTRGVYWSLPVLLLVSVVGVSSTAISQYQETLGENCILSFVVPRDKVRSSCDVNTKMQRRISAMEVKADVYRRHLAEVRAQLDKQTISMADRVAKLEAELSDYRLNTNYGHSYGQQSRHGAGGGMSFSDRLYHLERAVDQLQFKITADRSVSSGASRSRGRRSHHASSRHTRNWKDHHQHTESVKPHPNDSELETYIKSIVQAEVGQMSDQMRSYVLKQIMVYSHVADSLNPASQSDTAGSSNRGKTFAERGKIVLHDRDTQQRSWGDGLYEYVERDEDRRDDRGERRVRHFLVNGPGVKARIDRAGDQIAKHVGVLVKNMTQGNQRPTKVQQHRSSYGSEGDLRENISPLLEEDFTESNDTFSGETPDMNITDESSLSEEEEKFIIGSARMGYGDDTAANDTIKIFDEGDSNENEVADWLRDDLPKQLPDDIEERVRKEIKSMIAAPLTEVVGLLEKRADALEDRVQQQAGRTQREISHVTTRLDTLDRSSGAIDQKLNSLAQGHKEVLTRMDNVTVLETAVDEIKKNLSHSTKLLHDAQNKARGIGIETFDLLDKRVNKLERLMTVYKQSLQHYRNDTKHDYRELRLAADTNAAEIVKTSRMINDRIENHVDKKISELNATLSKGLSGLDKALESLEYQSVEMNVDFSRFKSKTERKMARDLNTFKDHVEDLRGRHRDSRRKMDRLEKSQSALRSNVSEVAALVAGMQTDVRLSVEDGWVQVDFDYDATRTDCFGDQYMKWSRYPGVMVGVVLCSPERYKIFLASSRHDKFLNIGDAHGLGDDHCEFVGAADDTKANLSPYDPNISSIRGYIRKYWGDKPVPSYIGRVRPSPKWYECGVSIP